MKRPPAPRRGRPARKTLRRAGVTMIAGLLLLACGLPALRPPTVASTVRRAEPPRPPRQDPAPLIGATAPADLVAEWAGRDPAAALRWIASQPADQAFDAGRLALVERIDRLLDRLDAVAEQAERVENPDLRRSALAEVVGVWRLVDPAAASSRLAAARSIDDIERAHLLELAAETPPPL